MSILSVKRRLGTEEEYPIKKQKVESPTCKHLPLAILNYMVAFLPYSQTKHLYPVCKLWNNINPNIKTFSSDGHSLTDSEIANVIKKCPHLTSIELYLPKESEKTFQTLVQLTHLTYIKLQGSIKSYHLENLVVLKLKHIRINSWKQVSNVHLHALAKIESLETIDLRNQLNIDLDGLKPLLKLKNLKKIDITFCAQISEDTIKSLHDLRMANDLPKVEIEYLVKRSE